MRFRILATSGLALALATALGLATPALANTINFGAPTDSFSCSFNGVVTQRSCTRSASITNGANDNTASAAVVAQASADQSLTTDPTANADIIVSYSIPYTVTRTVSITGPAPFNANVPIQTISFSINTTGMVSNDNSQEFGGFGQGSAFNGTISSVNGYFSAQTLNVAAATSTGGTGAIPISTSDFPSFGTSVNFSGAAAGEVTIVGQIPTDYRLWQDFSAPVVTNAGTTWQQSLTDTLIVSFRLRAESRAEGSVSTTGGEAIACLGQNSPLGSFTIDGGSGCGSGMQITATTTVTGTDVSAIPEPSSLLLFGGGLVGLAYAARRKLS